MKKFVLSLILSTSALQAADIDLRTWEPMSQTPAPSQRAMGLEEALSDLSAAIDQLAKVLVPATSQEGGTQKSGIAENKQMLKKEFLTILREKGRETALHFAWEKSKASEMDRNYALPWRFLTTLTAEQQMSFVTDSLNSKIVYDPAGAAYISISGWLPSSATYTRVYYYPEQRTFLEAKAIDPVMQNKDPVTLSFLQKLVYKFPILP